MHNNNFGFNGEILDTLLNNYHLGNGYRAYNPSIMQFTAPDDMSPFGHGGINPYMYCSGDPINKSDPSGHFHISVMDAIGIAGIFGGVILAGGFSTAVIVGIMAGVASSGTGVAAENTTGIGSTLLRRSSEVTGLIDPENEETAIARDLEGVSASSSGYIAGLAERPLLGMDRPLETNIPHSILKQPRPITIPRATVRQGESSSTILSHQIPKPHVQFKSPIASISIAYQLDKHETHAAAIVRKLSKEVGAKDGEVTRTFLEASHPVNHLRRPLTALKINTKLVNLTSEQFSHLYQERRILYRMDNQDYGGSVYYIIESFIR